MRITIRQLKRLIKEAVSDNGMLKKQLFRELTTALNNGEDEDTLFHISNVTQLSEFVSPELIDKLTSLYPTSEIMMMYGEWEFTSNK
jgi:hypothetical protein